MSGCDDAANVAQSIGMLAGERHAGKGAWLSLAPVPYADTSRNREPQAHKGGLDVTQDTGQRVEFRFADPAMADELEAHLAEQGVTDVERRTEEGVIPLLLPIVVGAALGGGALTGIILWIREKFGCLMVVDARGDGEPKISQHCEDRHGRVILIAADDAKIELQDVPPVFDFTAVAKAVIEGGAEAVKEAAESAGATAEVLAPDTQVPAGGG